MCEKCHEPVVNVFEGTGIRQMPNAPWGALHLTPSHGRFGIRLVFRWSSPHNSMVLTMLGGSLRPRFAEEMIPWPGIDDLTCHPSLTILAGQMVVRDRCFYVPSFIHDSGSTDVGQGSMLRTRDMRLRPIIDIRRIGRIKILKTSPWGTTDKKEPSDRAVRSAHA